MAFALRIDADRWRQHQDSVADAVLRAAGAPIVPVVKGNGYGLGNTRLAREAARLGAPLPVAAQVWQQLDALMGAGWGRDDTASLLRVLEG